MGTTDGVGVTQADAPGKLIRGFVHGVQLAPPPGEKYPSTH